VPLKWIPTPGSSAIVGFGYNNAKRILGIKFRHGATYFYFGVPKRIFEAMQAAPSKGRFVTERIKGTYSYDEK